MAFPRHTEVRQCAPGVEQTQGPWADYYRGTAEAPIAAGIITAAQIPSSPGLGKVQASFYDGRLLRKDERAPDKDERYQRVLRVGRRCEVTCGISCTERKRREAEREREAEAKQRVEGGARDADPERFRMIMQLYAQNLSQFLCDHTLGERPRGEPVFPCRFSGRGFDEVLEALETIAEWVEEAEVITPNPMDAKVSAARKDLGFQAFLQSQCLGGDHV